MTNDQQNLSKEQIIPLTLSPELKESGIVKSFAVIKRKGITNLVVDLNGKYNNRKAICDFSQRSWKTSQKNLKEALESKRVESGDITRIMDILDDNNGIILQKLIQNHDDSVNAGSGRSKRKKKETPDIPIFKYTARFKRPLHEAVLLNGEPCFVTWNQEKRVMECASYIVENRRILRPPEQEEYPYDPIEFKSLAELEEYVELAKYETIDSLYQKTKSAVVLYVDQDNDIIILISADIVWTYFQDLFATTHYYDVNGKANGIGKSSIGHMFEGIGYRVVRMTDPSAANLFRVLGTIEPGQCIIVADEADRIHKDRDALSILKEGYGKFGRVAKVNTNTLKQEFFFAYGFKIRIAEEPLRGNITKGVIDRSFSIKAIKGKPTHDIKEVLDPASPIERLQKLHNDLEHLRKLFLCFRLIRFNDPAIVADIDIGREGRDKELCKPVLQLFHGSEAYNEVRDTLFSFLDKKNRQKKSFAVEPDLFEIIVKLIEKDGLTISFNQIWNAIVNNNPKILGIPGVYDPSKPAEYHTYDFGVLYRNMISKTIEGFGAEHDKIKNIRVLKFDLQKLARTCKQFDVEYDVQTILNRIIDKVDVRAVLSYKSEKDENLTPDDLKSTGYYENNLPSGDVDDKNNPCTARTASTAICHEESVPPHTLYRLQSEPDIWGCQNCKINGDRFFMLRHTCSRSTS